ncbi:redoxin domain-containing protein [Neobacillus mesonae]|uniref:redoxin domain-containing protein n=1 Tax=Neobacillus mesonae TaxID=1193713 RepID=UPI00203B8F9F|nr:redoxin domain-containing protein [Neobacillus mesonae]MCM3567759.1 redoxin domain-containing protein [Neobacillus mesonae]
MFKKIAVVLVLAGLIGWAVYDHTSAPTNAEKTVEVSKPAQKKSAAIGFEEGNKAPNFQLQSLEGKTVQLSELKGTKLILNFWASWCPPCKAEMPHMQEFYQEQKGKNIEILSVNLTTAEKDPDGVQKFVKTYGLTFPVLLDSTGEIGDAYQAFTIPTSYFIDSNGIIVKKIIGPMDKEMMTELMNRMN